MKTFWQRSERYSPILCRLLARDEHRKPLSTVQIAERSGLTPAQVEAFSQSTSWVGIDLPTMRRFITACGMDFANGKDMDRADDYLRKRPVTMRYLRRSPHWDTYYKPMFIKWSESILCKTKTN